jgi:hypothetical protein
MTAKKLAIAALVAALGINIPSEVSLAQSLGSLDQPAKSKKSSILKNGKWCRLFIAGD